MPFTYLFISVFDLTIYLYHVLVFECFSYQYRTSFNFLCFSMFILAENVTCTEITYSVFDWKRIRRFICSSND